MLTATDARKASVHGTFRKPSTKRSEVVKPTSKKPPTISHSQGMKILSLDERRPLVTFPSHGEATHHRQYDRAAALPRVSRGDDRRLSNRRSPFRPVGTRGNGCFRRRRGPVHALLHPASQHARSTRHPRACDAE